MSSKTFTLDERLYAYLLSVTRTEPSILAQLRKETQRVELAVMQIAPEQGHLMALLVKLMGAKRCLEVGVYTGYSSLAVALALPADGKIIACDISEEWTDIAVRYWRLAGVANKIELKLQPASQTLDELIARGESGRFDFCFIDADKTSYETYYEQALTLLRPGGLMAIDNTLWFGRVADPEADDRDTKAIRAFNAMVAKDSRVFMSMIPIGDGLTLAMKH